MLHNFDCLIDLIYLFINNSNNMCTKYIFAKEKKYYRIKTLQDGPWDQKQHISQTSLVPLQNYRYYYYFEVMFFILSTFRYQRGKSSYLIKNPMFASGGYSVHRRKALSKSILRVVSEVAGRVNTTSSMQGLDRSLPGTQTTLSAT